jgi:hypothetical protein
LHRRPTEVQENIALLQRQGYTIGLAKALLANTDSFEQRIWIVDNSGSMTITDGHRINETTDGKLSITSVTRWEELQETVIYHAQMAAVLNSFTRFCLLNDPGPLIRQRELVVALPNDDIDREIHLVRTVMTKTKPDGVTPLTKHILKMQAEIREMLPQLQRTGRRVSLPCFVLKSKLLFI